MNSAVKALNQKLTSEVIEPIKSSQTLAAERVNYIEDQSRRNNLIFDGIPESHLENWEQSTKKIQKQVERQIQIRQSVYHGLGCFLARACRGALNAGSRNGGGSKAVS